MVRGKGEGSISQDANTGLWVGRIELPSRDIDAHGKPIRRRKVIRRKDKGELIREMAKARKLIGERGGDIPTASQTVEKWVSYWIREIAPGQIRPSAVSSYRSVVNRHVIPSIGSVRLERLTTGDVRRVLAKMEAGGAKPNYVKNAFAVMSSAFKVAEREGLIARNPCDLMDTPKKGRAELEVLTSDEVSRLLRTFEHSPEALIWATFMLTGTRRGEVLGLEWDRLRDGHIDLSWQLQRILWSHGCGPRPAKGQAGACGFKRAASCPERRVIVPHDYEYRHVTGALYWTRPKSQAGWRIIPLVEPLRSWLAAWEAKAPPNRYGLVFTDTNGEPIDPDHASEAWPRIREGVGIDRPVRLHDLRHSAIDMMYRAKVEEADIMRIFGHSTVQMSRSYRSKGNREREVEAMIRLSESLGYSQLEK
jgi:integrase